MFTYLKTFLLTLPKRPMLAREITIALIIKLLAMFILWKICFSHPVAEHISTLDIYHLTQS